MNNKTLVVGLIIISLFMVALSTRNGDVAWLILPFLTYLGVGILQTPVLAKLHLSAERYLEQTWSNGVAFIDVNLTIQNQAGATVHLFIKETAQAGMKITAGELKRRVTLRPHESTALHYTFTATRGDFSWQSVRILAGDPLGLIESEILLPAGAAIQVRPPVKKFKAIPLRPHSTVHAPGSIPARLGGSGTDFFGVREYHPGDPLRSLDWRLTARHPRRFFTKEFEQEEIAEVGLILDARQSTNGQIGAESLFEYSLAATVSLADMFLHQGHCVSLLVFAKTRLNVFPGYGKQQFQRILGCLAKANVAPEDGSSVPLGFLPIRLFPSRALIIIISSLTAADEDLFRRLRAYGCQVLLISPNPIDFAGPSLTPDTTTQLAVRSARIERRLRLNGIAHLQIPVIDWQVNQPLFPLVRHALSRRRGQRA